MAIQIVPLTEADIPGAIQVIQQAFQDDPYFMWVFDGDKFNKQRNYDSLTTRCLWGIRNALFYVAKEVEDVDSSSQGRNGIETDSGQSQIETGNPAETKKQQQPSPKILGVSCWLPPHPPSTPQTWSSWTQTFLLSLRQLLTNLRYLGRGGLVTRRYYIWKTRQREAQTQIWDDPRGYYFCNIVAVSPEAQGKGVGRRLVEVVTDRADREGRKCYLESSKKVPNVEIYRKMGFEVVREIECRDEGDVCMLYCMVRDPRTKA